jgi:DNA-directed RNA polymerase-3 subunit RPC5
MMNPNDELVAVLPIRYSEALTPGLQIHQFPLLNRPLQVPPSAALSGKRIRARVKPNARRIEVHIPADNRPEVWNTERGLSLGAARVLDDREKNQEAVRQREEEEPRLSEVRLRGQQLSQQGVHMLGVVRDGTDLRFKDPLLLIEFCTRPAAFASSQRYTPTTTHIDLFGRLIAQGQAL